MTSDEKLSALLDERVAIAMRLADWRRRWDDAVAAARGTAEHSMSGLKPLDDWAHELANARQVSPSLSDAEFTRRVLDTVRTAHARGALRLQP